MRQASWHSQRGWNVQNRNNRGFGGRRKSLLIFREEIGRTWGNGVPVSVTARRGGHAWRNCKMHTEEGRASSKNQAIG